MSMSSLTRRIYARKRLNRMDLSAWREEAAKLEKASLLKRQRYFVDFQELDRSVRRLERLLALRLSGPPQIQALRELISSLHVALNRANEKKQDTYSLRKSLDSLERKAIHLVCELVDGRRAPEFDRKDLERLIHDYQVLRR